MATRDERTGHLVPGKFTIVTSAASLARQLWRYGESELSRRALDLSPADVADVGIRAAEMADAGEPERLWSTGPGFAKGASSSPSSSSSRTQPDRRNAAAVFPRSSYPLRRNLRRRSGGRRTSR